jgi:hypothetical protein
MLARLGEAGEALADAHEELDAELLLQLADLAADAGLGGVQGLGDLGQVEAAALGLADGAELLEVHAPRFCELPLMLSPTFFQYPYSHPR